MGIGDGGDGGVESKRSGLVDLAYADDADIVNMLQEDPRDIIAGLMAAPGDGFLRWLSKHLQSSLGLDFAFIGEISGEDWSRIQTLEVCRLGEMLDNFTYELKHTPCSDVLDRGICYCASGVAEAYPEDMMLVDMNLESYVGISLFGDTGAPLGIAVLLHSEPITEEMGRAAAAKLRVFRPRIEAELTYRSAVHTMELAASDALTSQSTLESLVEVLAQSTRMRCAFVSVRNAADPTRARTLVNYADGNQNANTDYALAGTPCKRIGELAAVSISEGLQELYPDNEYIRKYNAQAYFGVAITNTQGELLGQIGLFHDRPVKTNVFGIPLVRLLVSRLTAEVRRREVERERAALERGLMDAKRNESIGTLASGIAHDFNNLLFAISGQAYVLQRKRVEDEPLQEQLQTIIDASEQASELCEQLLTYAGRRTSDVSTIDLNQVIRRCQRVASMFASEKAELITALHWSALPIVGSETRLQQVVMNLVKNAADAIVQDGSVRIETTVLQREARDFEAAIVGTGLGAGRYATMRISDDGCGMDAEQLRRSFEPFFTTKSAGRGLGLAVVCGSVEEQGGALEVASQVGLGSSFTISFPLVTPPSPGEEESEEGDATSTEDSKGGEILVIDDDRFVRKTLAAMLANEEMNAMLAESGAEGISIFRELHQSLDAVILDYTMPDMNGDQVLIALREISRAVPILMASGNIAATDLASFAEKPDAFIAKPFAPDILLKELRLLADPQGH